MTTTIAISKVNHPNTLQKIAALQGNALTMMRKQEEMM